MQSDHFQLPHAGESSDWEKQSTRVSQISVKENQPNKVGTTPHITLLHHCYYFHHSVKHMHYNMPHQSIYTTYPLLLIFPTTYKAIHTCHVQQQYNYLQHNFRHKLHINSPR